MLDTRKQEREDGCYVCVEKKDGSADCVRDEIFAKTEWCPRYVTVSCDNSIFITFGFPFS
jgi:hypothetical protein